MGQTIGFTTMFSRIGPLLLASTEEGLCYLGFGEEQQALPVFQRWARKMFLGAILEPDERGNQQAKTELEEYFSGNRKQFDVPIALHGTAFQKAVWQELTRIPYGETKSYKEIALALGQAKAVRAIGGANNRNPIPIIVPCHRVIGSNGALVGYGGGLSIKEQLLALEGAGKPSSHPESVKAIR
ncbi:methylated-DNA--[protein]-cysteine S-methyltransferase [Brevibacillus composti]|uniref:Methylated-DNA--protein-cysteine methyltransferase n=1 Tax=Brevibacillus composti TaxID=2796470 RepID=A0A7T5EJI5_9BACL|nr:methylated-DNA--[protein]-cysteine S-methyltransferase [Brevibacillus composti]QQE73764.1 methylated-DNA--[protein]-cysteine S-methyltransferase [Brevibacillus composti]QUO40847.1 methylated-DNA--[protein]-cysteine S-methyltransferase [Brevibacillus composti]